MAEEGATKKKSKSTLVTEVDNVIKLTNEMSSNDRCKFEAKIYGNFTRIYPASLRDKMIIHECLKHRKIQHYIIPGREIPLKVVIRGLRRFTDQDLLKETLACKGFCTTKISQLKSKCNGKPLSLLLADFPENETSYEFFKIKTIFNLRV